MKEQMREAFEAFWAEELARLNSDKNKYEPLKDGYLRCYQAALSAVPAQEPTEPKLSQRLIDTFQELNMGNYGDDDVRQLNDWAIEAYTALAAISKQPAQDQTEKDVAESITLLSAVFDAWENGTDCYDDFDGISGSFIGKAFNLDDEIFKRCCSLLNRINPPRNVSQQPAQEPTNKALESLGNSPEGFHASRIQLSQKPVKQESWISVDDVQSLVDASDILMKWLVKNVHQWNFSEYDWLSAATERVKASLPPVEVK